MDKKLAAELEQLPEDVKWHLLQCDGYLDLKMAAAARKELDQIPEPSRRSPFYSDALLRLHIEMQDWSAAADLARGLRSAMPEKPEYWIQLAYAVRRADGIEAARTLLLEGLHRFPAVAVIPFNLACYECQLGHRAEAIHYLGRAVKLDPNYAKAALEDEDLKTIWDDLER
jgi:predicted Zn-dependent protease